MGEHLLNTLYEYVMIIEEELRIKQLREIERKKNDCLRRGLNYDYELGDCEEKKEMDADEFLSDVERITRKRRECLSRNESYDIDNDKCVPKDPFADIKYIGIRRKDCEDKGLVYDMNLDGCRERRVVTRVKESEVDKIKEGLKNKEYLEAQAKRYQVKHDTSDVSDDEWL